ncbi:MAG: choice-of-anchor Q domain-containing protein, partial [Akkermansiaceae bacterium]
TVYDDQFDTPTGSAVSLREALRDARDGSLITFSPTLAFNVIDLSTSAFGQGTPLESSKNIIIDATMLASGVTVKGPGSGLRCLTLPDGPQTFSLHGISFRDGQGSTNGSAIYKGLETDLTITHSAVYNCISTNAAGAVHANGGYLTMQNVTLYNNGSVRGGSAISARNKAEVTLEHTTVYGNTISTTNFPGGAAVFLESNANLNCNHVAFGDNLNTQTNSVRNLLRFGPATFGVPIFTIADDTTAPATSRVPALHLKPLQDSGGLAHTCPPEGNSPVVNGGYSIFAGSPLTDARGFARKYGPRVDVGAYELGSFVTGTMNPPVDNDNDGMDDHWEEYYGLLFEAPGDDNDNDDLTNLGEYLSQTDPTSFDSIVPTKIIKLEEVPNNAGYSLTFSSSPGIAYEVWYSPDLSANSFIYLFTTNGRAQADETQAIIAPTSYGSGTKAFFRIQRP